MLPGTRTPSIRPSVLARYADIQPNYWPIIEGNSTGSTPRYGSANIDHLA